MSGPLTERERDILRRVARGDLRETIARETCRAPQTVKNTLTLIYEKLDAKNAPHAVYLALTRGLL